MNDSVYQFRESVWGYYRAHGRHDMLWRQPEADGSFDPYKILVSELMLQQTQVARVVPKYTAFIQSFPTVQALAAVTLGEVLTAWSGLGYNRRAKFLWQAACVVANDLGGKFPEDAASLQRLPGVGPNTAGAILAYAFNQPAIFIETNIRTAVIHHFFAGHDVVPDVQIREILQEAIDTEHPREFYWALMDYGSYLKRQVGNLNTHSASYIRQTAFAGSKRQVRGQVIRMLTERPYRESELQAILSDERLPAVLQDLTAEGLIVRDSAQVRLA